ncbi:DUF397 domain-containing protein [Streptomyces varsoviensis]|uniref:DUF397 domain-containing protein n=1 Tax=Streptomyces varsoviensis TaxID=67373 RepID=A0ABR5J4Y1_9ACTN|nr:DUF397 domain-containing protein [Streptomyces varsoviensis]KOG88458.1 hypothetical protein ADK38_19665 [Streptomyces varsoviensis]
MKNQEIVTAFKKAKASQGINTDCVEVARTADGGRAVRDSKNRDGGTQFYTPTEWAAFLDGVKAGEFDD